MFQEAGEIGSLEYELQVARYKVNRLIREQQKREMFGVMGSGDGPMNFKLKDDFYESAIQKGLDIVRKIEAQIQKQRITEEKLAIERRKLAIIESKSEDKTAPVNVVFNIPRPAKKDVGDHG